MVFKEILAPVITLEHDQAALTAAAEIAHAHGTRATALIVTVDLASAFAEHTAPFSEIMLDLAKGSRSHAAVQRGKILAWIESAPHDFDVRDVTVEDAVEQNEVVAHARVADLVVIARADAHHRARRALLERVIFKSGRPVLLVPPQVRERPWEKIVIGWNAKAEAVHAVAAAMPMLRRAKDVSVVTIDAKPSLAGHGEAPGRELAAYLARHGVKVDVHNVDSLGRSEGAVLLGEAQSAGADLIVMGAYGHSRAREMAFGGVTRDLLAASPVPLFMAH